MNTEHTPGKWTVVCDSRYSSPCLGKTLHSKKAAVHASNGESSIGPTVASHISNWNDARLIAAAPKLLVACKVAVYALERCGIPEMGCTIAVLKSAIADAGNQIPTPAISENLNQPLTGHKHAWQTLDNVRGQPVLQSCACGVRRDRAWNCDHFTPWQSC